MNYLLTWQKNPVEYNPLFNLCVVHFPPTMKDIISANNLEYYINNRTRNG